MEDAAGSRTKPDVVCRSAPDRRWLRGPEGLRQVHLRPRLAVVVPHEAEERIHDPDVLRARTPHVRDEAVRVFRALLPRGPVEAADDPALSEDPHIVWSGS